MVGYRGALEEACTDWPQICSITATPNSSSEDNREEVAAERRGHQELPKNSKLGPEKYIASVHYSEQHFISLALQIMISLDLAKL